jgi:ribosomal protein S6
MTMVKTARKYELVLIVDAKLTNESKEAIRKEVAEAINKHGG